MPVRAVLSVTSEIFPLIKTGGLADVAGALPLALEAADVRMRSLVPGYPSVMDAVSGWRPIAEIDDFFGTSAQLVVAEHKASGLDLIAVDAPALYGRPGNPYLDPAGNDWNDNHLRFAGLAYAAALLAQGIDTKWRPEVVHAHDWQGGLAALYCREMMGADGVGQVLTIHNIAFQGVFPPHTIADLKLPPSQFKIEGFEYHGQVGMLKAGIFYADKITTVSPTYAREIQTSQFGMGLEGLLYHRRQDLVGIVNGIDPTVWNPVEDRAIPSPYDSRTIDARTTNKAAVQKRFGLEENPERPLFCIVSRLTHQKGMDLVLAAIDRLVQAGGQLALIGTGDAMLEQGFIDAARDYSGQIGCVIGYDESLSHLLQSGADAILIPSRFEPCGLTQLYGLRYGCVPIVTRVGGLADTIVDANDFALRDSVATGIHLSQVSIDGLAGAIERAIELYHQPELWRAMQRRGMGRELGWRAAAEQYLSVYAGALEKRNQG